MSNLTKFITEKAIDIFEILILLTILFFVSRWAFAQGPTIGWIALVVGLIIFWAISKYTGKFFERYQTPFKTRDEEKNYLIWDTTYNVLLIALIIFLLFPYIELSFLVVVFGTMLALKEFFKWRDFKREI